MGTELVGPCVKDDSMDIPSIPPGFESLVPFTLKRVDDNQTTDSESQTVKLEPAVDSNDDSKAVKSLRRRPGIKYSQFDYGSSDEYESEQQMVLRQQLPKGVIRGCEECRNCQKVTAKWHPEEARRPNLEDAPVFYPSEEEFEDTLKYISSIRAKAEMHGICRIVPPPSWKPPCPLKEMNMWEKSNFTTRVQRVDKLQNRYSMRKILQANNPKRRKKRKCMKSGGDSENGNEEIQIPVEIAQYEAEWFGFEPGPEFTLSAFQKYADDFKEQYFRKNSSETTLEEQWQPSLENIEGEYWRMVEKPTEEIEVLYGADLETGVFGSGFPKNPQQVGDASHMKYISSGWNLNNFPKLPGSVLSFESGDISGVLVPWLYIGMCFSSFCWGITRRNRLPDLFRDQMLSHLFLKFQIDSKGLQQQEIIGSLPRAMRTSIWHSLFSSKVGVLVSRSVQRIALTHVEDHHLYSLNYLHWGAPKMWYGVPGSDALKLESAMRKHLPDLFEEQPDLLHKLVTQLSPSILKSEGVPVYRCVQNPGEFVLTFPRSYHAGFNSGFNCAEAVNVAPVDWLPHGQNAIELYRQQGRKTSISHDKLLLGAAREAVKANWEFNLLRKSTSNILRWKNVCGKDGILSKALKSRVEMERVRREFLCKSSQALKMESSFDANSERECSVCLFDLHLSAAGCHHCSPHKYACLNHAKQLCTCSWGAKFFLFRYDINELNILVEALEGKLSAVYRWARLDLGLALSSYVTKDNLQKASQVKETSSSLPTIVSSKEQKNGDIMNSTNSAQKANPPIVVLALENTKTLLHITSQRVEGAKNVLQCKIPKSKAPSSSQLSRVNNGLKITETLASEKPQEKPGNRDVILLSDDEGDEPTNKPPYVENMASVVTSTNAPALKTTPVILETMKHVPDSEGIKVEENPLDISCSKSDADCNKDVPVKKETPDGDEDGLHKQRIHDEKPPCNAHSHKHVEMDVDPRSMDNIQSTSSGSQNILDRFYRQKGPRIAKVVRRINCNVEPLEYGVVCAGKLWCDSRAIYPKGFKSRIRYIDVLDPSNMCYYISEILDAGRNMPLFMVSVEHSPSEVFIHMSATRCWEMVRERVNNVIAKKHKLGRDKLPPLQPPGSLDGIEMFGFSSPQIVQVIQGMDRNRISTEYWKSRPLMKIPQQSQSQSVESILKSEPLNDSDPERVERIVNGLFNKANPEELRTLYTLLSNTNSTHDQSLLTRLLNQEINRHPK